MCVVHTGKHGLLSHGVLVLVPYYKGRESDAKELRYTEENVKLFMGSFLALGLEGLLRGEGQRLGVSLLETGM